MKIRTPLAIGLVALTLTGCVSDQLSNKQTWGTLLGAGGGALAGSQIGSGKGQLAAVAVGTLAGAFLGGEVGKSLDRADRLALERTTQDTLETAPSGRPMRWSNPDSGHSGTVVAEPAYKGSGGRYCREYQQTVLIGGEAQSAYGTACRQPDGSWQIAGR